jgi:hypothetical protein
MTRPDLPAITFEVAFTGGATTGTYLHLDDVTRGILDTATLGPDDLWTDVSDDVQTISVSRPGTRGEGPLVKYEAGTATVQLRDRDRRYDPTNLDGPYVAGGATQVTPMRAARLLASWAGAAYNVWRGNANGWQVTWQDPNSSRVVFSGTDAFKILSRNVRPAVAPVGAGEFSGARIERILDAITWDDADRMIAAGDTTLQATDLEGDVLSELQLVAESELGEVYVDGAGRIVFLNRNALLTDARSNTSQATFGDANDGVELRMVDVDVSYDDTQLINRARITREGGSEQTANDAVSETAYLTAVHERSGLLMETDVAALNYAQWVVYQSKDPELRFDTLTIKPRRDPAALWPQTLGRELGDRITVVRRPPNGGDPIERDVFIRGIAHEFTNDPLDWTTTFTLQSAVKGSFLVLDNAVLGQLDGNALAF